MCIATVCKPGYNVIKFKLTDLSNQAVLINHDQKVVTKTQISCERKELLRWNKKHFLSLLKGFQSSKEHKFFLEGDSPTLKNLSPGQF